MSWINGKVQLPDPETADVEMSAVHPQSLFLRVIRFPLTLIILGCVFYLTVQIVAGTTRALIMPHGTSLVPFFEGHPADLIYGIGAAALSVLAYWLLCLVEDRDMVDFAGWRWKRELCGGMILGAGLIVILTGFVGLMGNYRIVGWGHAGFGGFAAMLGLAISSGVGEEILFRGIIFRLTEKMLGSWFALAFSAGLFGLLHIGNANATWFSSAAIAVEAGILLGAIYMLTRRLWAAIGFHAAWNFVQGWVFDIPVSGNKTPALVAAQISGSDWMTGGAFGLEASVPALIVATAAGLAILRLAVQRGQIKRPMWAKNEMGVKKDRPDALEPAPVNPSVK